MPWNSFTLLQGFLRNLITNKYQNSKQVLIQITKTLAKNKNNHHENKTKDTSSISTKADIVNNADKLLALLDEDTKIKKDNPIWQTMSISAGNDAILLLNVCTPRRATKNIHYH